MAEARQLPFDLAQPTSYALADFIVAPSNADAFRFVEEWSEAAGHFAALVGPVGSGKSHLLAGWAAEVSAGVIAPGDDISALKPGALYVIDDVDQRTAGGSAAYDDSFLFHLFNWSKEIGAKLLVSAATPPTQWNRALPDLMSRLGTLPVAVIDEPDDQLLMALLIKLFSDKQLQVDLDVIQYLLPRMDRSFAGAHRLVALMDRKALAERRRITKALARETLADSA